MSGLLHISASPRADRSESRRYGSTLVARLRAAQPDLAVMRRDLYLTPLPHPERDFVEASLMPADRRGCAENAVLALSEQLIGEIETADVIVIDTPIYNFTLPSVLKAWIDYVVRPGRTFHNTAQGKIGLLADRPVHCLMASGGPLSDDGTGQPDFATPYLRHVLAIIGLRSVSVIRLDGLRRGPDAIKRSDDRFSEWLRRLSSVQADSGVD